MGKYIFMRLLAVIPILLGVTVLIFGLVHLVPGDPVDVFLHISEIYPTPEVLAETRAEMGLDRPLLIQYADWLNKVLHFDFGKSYIHKTPVLDELLYYFPATIELTAAAMVVMLMISLPVGIFSALYKGSWLDQFSRGFSFLGASMPNYWLGLLLIYFFSIKLDLLPTQGKGTLANLVLPALALALGYCSVYTRLIRTSMLENIGACHVLYARARGLKERVVIIRHVLKNACLPVITAFGMSFGHMLAGAVVIESVFGWPGVGRYCVAAIFSRDYPVIQAYVLMMGTIFVFSNLAVDILCHVLNPRLMKEGGS